MLGECDIVGGGGALSCALTSETTGLLTAAGLPAMKPGAFLVNLARGPIAREQAHYRALRDGVIGGAALDTWWRYPSADDPAPRPSRYPFHEPPNVVMTPHCSPRTDGTTERRSRCTETSTALSVASRLKTSSPRPDKLKRTARSELTAEENRSEWARFWTATPTGVRLFPKLKVDVELLSRILLVHGRMAHSQ